MIHTGDLFYPKDLYQSVYEILCTDWCSILKKPLYIDTNKHELQNLVELGPVKYSAMIISDYDTKSSAHHLDKQLKDAGYKTTYSFAHKYRMTPEMRTRILSDVSKLDWFYQVCRHPALSKKEYTQMIPIFQDAVNISYFYAQFLWANNPDAKFDYQTRLKPWLDWDKVLNYLYGVAYEFHPKDVYKHITDWRPHGKLYHEQLEFKNWCRDNYGIDTGCLVLSNDNMEKLRKILTKTDKPYPIQVLRKFFTLSK